MKSPKSIARQSHGILQDGGRYLIVGGYLSGRSLMTERCSIGATSTTCAEQLPDLNEYHTYPEMTMVEEDFCKTL